MDQHSTFCPSCLSTDTRYRPSRSEWICEACDHRWMPKPSEGISPTKKADVPLKIFLSYGHDEYVKDAERIKSDLEQRGHVVWFDQEILKSGIDWEQYIEDGLQHCDRVVLLMTPYSVRRPNGYCLNEIAKALERNKVIIPVMLVELINGPPTSICRIQYFDLRGGVPISEREEHYRGRFNRLAHAIESNQLDFEGGQARLLRYLQPLNFDAQIAPHVARFSGRAWLFRELDDWLANRPESRVLWIFGGPGIGKTAIAAQLVHRRPDVFASHFCVHGHDDKSDPRRVVLSIAYQLAAHIPPYYAALKELALEDEQGKSAVTLFDNLIVAPLSAPGFPKPEGNCLVVIDAIDEATRENRNEVADFIAMYWQRTPSWLRLVITSRPESAVLSRLQHSHLHPYPLDARRAENLADLRDHLRQRLHKQDCKAPERVLDAILERSEGIFLYVATVLAELESGRLSLDRIEDFPRGMAGYYQQYFARQFVNGAEYAQQLRPILSAIVAQRAPLPLIILATATQHSDFMLRQCLSSLGSLFPIRVLDGVDTVSAFHKSVDDWLTGRDSLTRLPVAGVYAVDREGGNARLADACWSEYKHGPETLSPYGLRHLVRHLVEARRLNDTFTVLTDLQFLEARNSADLLFELPSEFHMAISLLAPSDVRVKILVLLEEALRRDIHFINRHSQDYPQALFQCLWNTCWWYDCPAANEHYCSPSPVSFASVVARPSENGQLHRLMEKWKQLVELRPESWYWLRSLRPPEIPLGVGQEAMLVGHQGGVTSLAYAPSGGRLASGSGDQTVRIWDIESSLEVACLIGHSGNVESLAYRPQGDILASASIDRSIRLWDTATHIETCCLLGHEGAIFSLAWTPDGSHLVSCSEDGTIRVWDVSAGAEVRCFRGHEGWVWGISISRDGHWLASAGEDRTVRVWDFRGGQCTQVCQGHEGWVWSVSITATGDQIVSSSTDRTIRVWNAMTGSEVRCFRGHNHHVRNVYLSPNGCSILSVSYDRTAKVWDLLTGTASVNLPSHPQYITCAAWSPDGKSLATGSAAVRVFSIDEKYVLRQLPEHDSSIQSVAVSHDEQFIVSTTRDGDIRLWSGKTGLMIVQLAMLDYGVTSVNFSSDGAQVLCQLADETELRLDITPSIIGTPAPISKQSADAEIGRRWQVQIRKNETSLASEQTPKQSVWLPASLYLHSEHSLRQLLAGSIGTQVQLYRLESTGSPCGQ